MLEFLIYTITQILLTALMLKLYHDLVIKSKKNNTKGIVDSLHNIEKLEQRLVQLSLRESTAQETIWKLEDENLLLKTRNRELTNRSMNNN